jgi:hypothetical protein
LTYAKRGEGIGRGKLLSVEEGKAERTKGGKLFPQRERERQRQRERETEWKGKRAEICCVA